MGGVLSAVLQVGSYNSTNTDAAAGRKVEILTQLLQEVGCTRRQLR
jgi:hypothetical protein